MNTGIFLSSLFVTSIISTAVQAQQSDAPSGVAEQPAVGEIIVTAQKRAENIQDVPISIVALSTRDLENRGVTGVADLRAHIPNLQIAPHPNSATTARVFIRGIGANDDQVTLDPGVAVYVDGVYIARSQGLVADTAELERIEVLRGPQGTLYGRNASGGAINFITKPPELNELRLKQSVTVGNYSQFQSKTSVNVPIGSTAAIQLAYLHSQKNGFVDNIGTGVARFGDQRRDSYRAAIRWLPSENLEFRYAYDRSEIGDTPAFLARVALYPARSSRPAAGSAFVHDLKRNDVTVQGHSLTATLDVGDLLTVKSITGYRKLDNFTYMDYHSGVFGPSQLLITSFDQGQSQVTEELQFIGKTRREDLTYIAGFYYFSENADSFDINLFPTSQSDRNVSIKNTAYAAYGQATLSPLFADGVHVTAGLRYSHDSRKAILDQAVRNQQGLITSILPTGRGDRKFNNVSPYFALGYEPNDDINLYAKWAKGYKTGGFNTRSSSLSRFEEGFNEENISVIELGSKIDLLDRRLRINAAAFRGKYKDIQVNIQSSATNPIPTDLLNAGKANISGFEIDINARPVDELALSLSYGYLDAKYKKVVNAQGVDISNIIAFVEAPKNTFAATAQYTFPATGIGELSAFVEASFQDKRFGTALSRAFIIPDYTLISARLTLSEIPIGHGRWTASIFGRNLSNQNYYTSHFSAGVPTAIFGEPRTFGAELKVEF